MAHTHGTDYYTHVHQYTFGGRLFSITLLGLLFFFSCSNSSDFTNSGTQCCYGDDGHLMYAGDTDQGSTADRSHVWGAEPYQAIDMVPGLSHWKHDVITFYYCCLWGDDCKTYLMLRPTADCKEYNPPRACKLLLDQV